MQQNGFLSFDQSTWIDVMYDRSFVVPIENQKEEQSGEALLFLDIIKSTKLLKESLRNAWILQAFWTEIKDIVHGEVKGDGAWLGVTCFEKEVKILVQEICSRYGISVRIQAGGEDGRILSEIHPEDSKYFGEKTGYRKVSIPAIFDESYVIIGSKLPENKKVFYQVNKDVIFRGKKTNVRITKDPRYIHQLWACENTEKFSIVKGNWTQTRTGGLIGESLHLAFRLYGASQEYYKKLAIRCDLEGRMFSFQVRDVDEWIVQAA